MTEHTLSLLVLLFGLVTVAAVLIRAGMEGIGLPAVVGYLVLGFGIRLLDDAWNVLASSGMGVFRFLAQLGVIALLFRVGLESNPSALLRRLRSVSGVWFGNVAVTAVLVFAAARWIGGLDPIPSAVIATALTATSVGVTVPIWREVGALDTPDGERFLDVAELDDVSGILLLALLFAVLPDLRQGNGLGAALTTGLGAGVLALAKLTAFAVAVFVFSRSGERPMTALIGRVTPKATVLVVVGTGFVVASVAGLLGFSVAIGAFFAGLAFSRDPDSVRIDASIDPLYELLSPFFFVGMGLLIVPSSLVAGGALGLVLLAAGVAGKMVGAGVPALRFGRASALLMGVSLLPRAEIALVVAERGSDLGSWALPDEAFSAVVLVSFATTLGVPPLLYRLLQRQPLPAGGAP